MGVLDFVFDDHKHDETIVHVVELKNQHCDVFYEKLKFIYIELPKFTKSINELESRRDKWLFLLRHLAELTDRPDLLQDSIFSQLFEVAEIANFSRVEQDGYQNSLKYYRDMNNVVDTSRQEGKKEGREEGRKEGREEGQRSLILRQLTRCVGILPDDLTDRIQVLPIAQIEVLAETLFDFNNLDDLRDWLDRNEDERS